MPLDKLNAFTKKVQDLADKPNSTMSAAEVKAQFDAAPNELRLAFNQLIDDLGSVVDGDSGADNIGATPIGTSPATIQGILEWLKTQMDSTILGQIPDGTVTPVKLSFDPATQEELQAETTARTTHTADLTSHVPFGVDTGTANAKVVTLSPAPTAYVEGMAFAFKNIVANTGAVTVTVNGLGAVPVVKSNGNALTSGNLRAGSIYTVRKGTTSFILQGEGGEIPKIPNIARNGSFENALVNWDVVMNATSVVTPVKYGTKSAEVIASNSRAYLGVERDGVFFVPKANSKYYMSGNFYVKSYSTGTPSILMRATTENVDVRELIDTTKIGQWQFKSLIFDTTGKTLTTIDYFAVHDGGVTTSTFDIVTDGIMILNLTEAFGVGSEPSKDDMDSMIQLNGGWWDNELTLLTSNATAISSDIMNTKTAYVNGSKITGTYTDRANGTLPAGSTSRTVNTLPFSPSYVILWATNPSASSKNFDIRIIRSTAFPYQGAINGAIPFGTVVTQATSGGTNNGYQLGSADRTFSANGFTINGLDTTSNYDFVAIK